MNTIVAFRGKGFIWNGFSNGITFLAKVGYKYILSLFSENTREDIKSVESLVMDYVEFSKSLFEEEETSNMVFRLLYYGLVFVIHQSLYEDDFKKLHPIWMDRQEFEETRKISNYAFKVMRVVTT